MPVSNIGQLITFAIERDADETIGQKFIWVHVGKSTRTIAKIAAHRGHPEDARTIADLNGIRSVDKVLPLHKRIKLPGRLHDADVFHVLPQDGQPPTVVGGYAKFEIIDRPERAGLTQFDGYDPVQMTIPIQFEGWRDGTFIPQPPQPKLPFPGARPQIVSDPHRGAGVGIGIEQDIALLERMAGRGNFSGAAVGPPPVIRISTTNSTGKTIPLIPTNYQWRPQNKSAPLWRVTGIDWDDRPLRNPAGNRLRQLATVTVQQHTHVAVIERSAAKRSKTKRHPPVNKQDQSTFFADPSMLDFA